MTARRQTRIALLARARPDRGQPSGQCAPEQALARTIGTLLTSLELIARNPCTPLDTLVHEVRLATKTLRAYVRLLETTGSGHSLQELHTLSDRLRHIALELGGARDAVVIRRTLRSLAHDTPLLRPNRRESASAGPASEPSSQSARPMTRTAVQRHVRALINTGAALQREIRQPQHPLPLARGLRDHYTALRARGKRLRKQPDSAAWHRWRKRAKAFHYQLAWLGDALPRRLRRLARRAWKLQRELGDHHDLGLVRAWLDRIEPRPRDQDRHRRLLSLCLKATQQAERRVKRQSRRFARIEPKTFDRLVARALARTSRG